jgi:hypothetical protein
VVGVGDIELLILGGRGKMAVPVAVVVLAEAADQRQAGRVTPVVAVLFMAAGAAEVLGVLEAITTQPLEHILTAVQV